MKRHLVMDLFYAKDTESVGDWQPFPEITPERNNKILIELVNGNQIFAYFYKNLPDFYMRSVTKEEISHFWDVITKEPISESSIKRFKYLKSPEDATSSPHP